MRGAIKIAFRVLDLLWLSNSETEWRDGETPLRALGRSGLSLSVQTYDTERWWARETPLHSQDTPVVEAHADRLAW